MSNISNRLRIGLTSAIPVICVFFLGADCPPPGTPTCNERCRLVDADTHCVTPTNCYDEFDINDAWGHVRCCYSTPEDKSNSDDEFDIYQDDEYELEVDIQGPILDVQDYLAQ